MYCGIMNLEESGHRRTQMKYNQEIILKNGAWAHLRNGDASDGLAVYEIFNQTHAETDYLLSSFHDSGKESIWF